jgi:O-antigen ligase
VGLLGDTGRNIGFLNYFFLSLIALYASVKLHLGNIKNIYSTVFALGTLFALYGTLQHFKIDFLKWNTQYNPIILTTGNPDFAASLLGLFVVICFAALFIDFSRLTKVYLILLIILTVTVIFWTHALQGLVATAAGVGLILFVLMWGKNRRLALGLLALELFTASLSILGMLQMGPLTKYFFKASITDRGYDWRAAVGMFKSHPLFGVGVDRYASYFMQYRAPKYPLLYGYSQTVNNAHNIFLQIFATAGIFAGVTYIGMISFIAFRAFVAIRGSNGKERITITGIVAGWIVFLAQSIISVDSLAISIWGWVLGGSIIGLSVIQEESQPTTSVGQARKTWQVNRKRAIAYVSPYRSVIFSLGLIFLCLLVVPMYRNETATLKFAQIQSPSDEAGKDIYRAIAKKTFDQPLLNPNYKANIAIAMAKNDYGPEAITFFKQTIKTDPRNINSYSLIALVYENLNNPREAITYRKQLARLDPYNAENFLSLANDFLLIGDENSAISARNTIISMAPGTDVAKQAEKLFAKNRAQIKK